MKAIAWDLLRALGYLALFVLIMAGLAGFALRFLEVLPYLFNPNY